MTVQTPSSPTPSSSHSPAPRLARLLIVDDETELMTALCEAMVKQGYEAAGFTSGKEALGALKEQEFDLLLTDLMMPEMDGIALLRAALEIDPHLVGVVMTGQGTIQTAVEAMKIGAFDYVLKPFKLREMLPVLSRALEVRRLRVENVQLRETVAIHELSEAIAFTLDLSTILNKLADAALQQCQADEVSVMLPTREGDELYVVVARGGGRERLLGERIPMAQGIAGWVARHGEPLTLHGEVADPRFAPVRPRPDIHASISMPMMVGGKLVGVLNVNATRPRRSFTLGQVKALQILTGTAASALESAWLFTQVREAEEKYRSIFENAVEGIFQNAPDGRIFTVNPALARMYGYESPEEMIATVTDLDHQLYVSPEHRKEYQERLEKHGVVRGFETQLHRKDGSNIWASINAHLVRDSGGAALYYEGTVEDITERKRAEEGQRQQLERVNLLNQIARAIAERQDLESIFQAVLSRLEDHFPVDYGSIFLYAPETDTLTAIARGPKTRTVAAEVGLFEHEAFVVKNTPFHRCLEGETVYLPDLTQADAPIPKKLAQAGIRSSVGVPMVTEGRMIGVMIVWRRSADGFSSEEIASLRALVEHVALAAHQAQLRQSLQEAYENLRRTQQAVMQQERLKALGQMASGIAHDVNNALSPILGYAQMLLLDEEKLTSEQVHYLNIIEQSARDITQIVARMREFYRQREAQELLLPVSLNEMAQQVIDLTRPRWRDMPQERGVVIETQTDLQDRLPSVLGIESEVREALTNLIFNAVDALPRGGRIKIKTGIRGQGSGDGKNKSRDQDGGEREMAPTPDPRPPEGGQWVEVEVTDTGTGMDEETRRRCLEPFYSTKGEKGTGLGLAMVFGVMQRHEGGIEMESEVGRGTTVRLIFPMPQAGASRGLRPEQEDQPVPPLRVLCVEDDPAVREVAKLMLKKDGHAVTVADGGQAGLDAFRAARERGEPFDVVLTDLGMPYVDGIEVARGVKRESPATPVIMLSGWGKGALSREEIPAEMDIVLGKPPELHALRRALRQVSAKGHI